MSGGIQEDLECRPAAVGSACCHGRAGFQQLLTVRLGLDQKLARVGDANFDFITLLQLRRFDNGSGKADGKAVAPFCNLHCTLNGYTCGRNYVRCPKINLQDAGSLWHRPLRDGLIG
jgi:hypothetical protein